MDTHIQALWTERIRVYQASGQTMKAWCTEQNLTLHQLKYWLYKSQRRELLASNSPYLFIKMGAPHETETRGLARLTDSLTYDYFRFVS